METSYLSTQKFFRMSPRKLRLVADAVKKMRPVDAIEALPFSGKRAAHPLSKVIKTAVANAVAAGVDAQTLVFKEIQINQGPTLKRGIAVSRGQWHPIMKRMSHIRVAVVAGQAKPEVSEKAVEAEVVSAPVVTEKKAKKVTKKETNK